MTDARVLADRIGGILVSKKAQDVTGICVTGQTIVADYYVIATGKSTPHVKALCEYVEEELEKEGITVLRRDGVREGRWAVLDYGDVIVHVFSDETRLFYKLEKLWAGSDNVIEYADE